MEMYLSIVQFIICSLGVIGNILSLCQLRRTVTNKTLTNILRSLAVTDAIFLILFVFTFILPTISDTYYMNLYVFLQPILLPLEAIIMAESVFLFGSCLVEKYFTMYRPTCADKGFFFGFLAPTAGFCILFNIPKFFELETAYAKLPNGDWTAEELTVSEFRTSFEYLFFSIPNLFMISIVPFIVIIFFTCKILIKQETQRTSQENSSKSCNQRLFYLLGPSVMILLHMPRTLLTVYELYLALLTQADPVDSEWAIDLSHLCLVVSSSTNTFILSLQDESFRKQIFHGDRQRSSEQRTDFEMIVVPEERDQMNNNSHPE